MNRLEKVIFEKSRKGVNAYRISENRTDHDIKRHIPDSLIRDDLHFPEMPENEVVRHFVRLSKLNFSVDEGLYPLGSCTMKYNPKINERVAALPGFTQTHPENPHDMVQGNLQLIYELAEYMSEITGMHKATLAPVAGASGEMTGLKIIREYHRKNGNTHKNVIILPDSAHGTNPASAAMAGFEVKEVPSDPDGGIDIKHLKEMVDDNVAGFMLTNPNTLGVYDKNIMEIADIFHEFDAPLYYDGANLNAIMGKVKPGDMGFDIVHINLHKTFSAPHGGGGPGAGPVAVRKRFDEFLPIPRVIKENNYYRLDSGKGSSIGKVHSFFGNFSVLVKAYVYIRMLGGDGLRKTSECAVLNSNYLMKRLSEDWKIPYSADCMHEFVLSAKDVKKNNGVSAMDIAKRLLDHGYHAPTMYFPLIVEEALMIEPTETESREELDEFVNIMKSIRKECEDSPEVLHRAPVNTPVRRVDDVTAARKPRINYYNDHVS